MVREGVPSDANTHSVEARVSMISLQDSEFGTLLKFSRISKWFWNIVISLSELFQLLLPSFDFIPTALNMLAPLGKSLFWHRYYEEKFSFA